MKGNGKRRGSLPLYSEDPSSKALYSGVLCHPLPGTPTHLAALPARLKCGDGGGNIIFFSGTIISRAPPLLRPLAVVTSVASLASSEST